MIPKIIHYCWFGGNPLPELAQKCIASWKKHCPDYEIIEWNESNIDFSIMPLYVTEAYKAQKWGFVPDYIRLWIIYNYGGIYLDTDVEIIKPLDDLLCLSGFCGLEVGNYVALGLGFGAEKSNSIISELMNPYLKMRFINPDGSFNIIPAPRIDTVLFQKKGLLLINEEQKIGDMTVFPTEYFCPKDFCTGELSITSKTFTIHHYTASWFTDEEKSIRMLYLEFIKKYPKKIAHWMSLIVFFSKSKGVLKMPITMIKYKQNNLKRIKEDKEKIKNIFESSF